MVNPGVKGRGKKKARGAVKMNKNGQFEPFLQANAIGTIIDSDDEETNDLS